MLNFAVALTDQVSGPAKQASGALSGLAGGLESLADPATAAVVAIGVLTTAVVGLGVVLFEGAQIALEASDAYEDMVTQFDSLGEGVDAGKETVAMLDDLSRSLPKTRKELADWATTLEAAGETNLDDVHQSLVAIASAEALMGSHGKEAASQVEALLKKVNEAELSGGHLKMADKQLASLATTGVNVDDVAKKMGLSAKQLRDQLKAGTADAAKFGDALQEALIEKGAGAIQGNLNDIPVLVDKAKASFTQLFEGVDTGGFTKGLGDLVGLLDSSSTSGKALKWAITTLFNSLFSMAQKVLPYVHLFFLKLINAGLRIYIIFKPVIKHFADLWSQINAGQDSISLMDLFVDTLVGGAMMAAFFAESLATVVGWVLALGSAVSDAYTAITDWLTSIVKSVKDFFNGDQGNSMGGNLVDDLVSGITANAQKVIDAMTNLAKNALGSAKKTLGIASPSKAMIEMGGFMGEGMAIGVSGAANDVSDAVGGMAQSAMAAVPSSGGSAGGGGGVNVTVEAGAIVINGAGGDVSELTEEAVSLIWERVALSQGLGATG